MNNIISRFSLFTAVVLLWMAVPVISLAAHTAEVESNDTAAEAFLLDPFFSYGMSPNIEIDEKWNPAHYSASVIGTGINTTYDYYSFSVGTGDNNLRLNALVYFDIDLAQLTGLDSFLTLYDTDGITELTSNNNSLFNGPGDYLPVTTNSFFSYSFDTAGIYYVRVAQNDGGSGAPIASPSTYYLHLSSVPLPSTIFLMIIGLAGFIGLKRKSWL